MRALSIGILLTAPALVYAQDSVSIRETSIDRFVATLVSDREWSTGDAQLRVLEAAIRTCKDRTPQLEHYDFESRKLISTAPSTSTTPAPDRFEFNQQFLCQEALVTVSESTSPTVISEEEHKKLGRMVTDETRRVIGSAGKDTLHEFHTKFSKTLGAMLPLTQWIQQQMRLHKTAGALKDSPLLNVTTYVDPPDSPGPGIYIAVDFQASYENAPFRCGYVMWLLDPESNLTVLRLEDGILYGEDAALMTSEEIEQAKQQFRCLVP